MLEEAFVGHFTDHHAFLLRTMLARIDETSADIAAVEAKVAELIAPFAQAVERLDEIPGVGVTAAHVMIAEIGLDMSRFPTAAHLCSWARLAPGVKESAGKKKGRGSTGHGNPYLARVLGEAAVAAAKTDTFLANATGASPDAVGRRRPSSRSAAPSWSSSGTCCLTPRLGFTTSDPSSTTTGPAPTARSATTSGNSRPSATRSPSNPQPDHPFAHPAPPSP